MTVWRDEVEGFLPTAPRDKGIIEKTTETVGKVIKPILNVSGVTDLVVGTKEIFTGETTVVDKSIAEAEYYGDKIGSGINKMKMTFHELKWDAYDTKIKMAEDKIGYYEEQLKLNPNKEEFINAKIEEENEALKLYNELLPIEIDKAQEHRELVQGFRAEAEERIKDRAFYERLPIQIQGGLLELASNPFDIAKEIGINYASGGLASFAKLGTKGSMALRVGLQGVENAIDNYTDQKQVYGEATFNDAIVGFGTGAALGGVFEIGRAIGGKHIDVKVEEGLSKPVTEIADDVADLKEIQKNIVDNLKKQGEATGNPVTDSEILDTMKVRDEPVKEVIEKATKYKADMDKADVLQKEIAEKKTLIEELEKIEKEKGIAESYKGKEVEQADVIGEIEALEKVKGDKTTKIDLESQARATIKKSEELLQETMELQKLRKDISEKIKELEALEPELKKAKEFIEDMEGARLEPDLEKTSDLVLNDPKPARVSLDKETKIKAFREDINVHHKIIEEVQTHNKAVEEIHVTFEQFEQLKKQFDEELKVQKAKEVQIGAEETVKEILEAVKIGDNFLDYEWLRRAFSGSYMDSDKMAKSTIESEISFLRNLFEENSAKFKGTDQEQMFIENWNYWVNRYKKQLTDYYGTYSRHASSAVTGGGNFPVARMEKLNDLIHRKQGELIQLRDKMINNIGKAKAEKIDPNLRFDARVKEIKDEILSGIARNIKDSLETKSISSYGKESSIRQFDNLYKKAKLDFSLIDEYENLLNLVQETPKKHGTKPLFTKKHRVYKALEQLREIQKKAPNKTGNAIQTKSYKGVEVKANVDADRLQLFFDEKPGEAVRADLKKSGWRWSNKEGAWQRQLTDNAQRSADNLLGKHFEEAANIETNIKSALANTEPTPKSLEQLENLVREWKQKLKGTALEKELPDVDSPEWQKLTPEQKKEPLFKLNIQLFAKKKITPEEIFKQNAEFLKEKALKTGYGAMTNILKKLEEADIDINGNTFRKIFNSNFSQKVKALNKLIEVDLERSFSMTDKNGNVLGAREIFDILEEAGREGQLKSLLLNGTAKDMPEGTLRALMDYAQKVDGYIDPMFKGNPNLDKEWALKSLMISPTKVWDKYITHNKVSKFKQYLDGEEAFFPTSKEIKKARNRFTYEWAEFMEGDNEFAKSKNAGKVFDKLFGTVVGDTANNSKLRGTSLTKFSRLEPFMDERLIKKENLSKLIDEFSVDDRTLANRLNKATSDASSLFNTYGLKPQEVVFGIKEHVRRNFQKGNKETSPKFDANFRDIEALVREQTHYHSEYDNYINKVIASHVGKMYKLKLAMSAWAKQADDFVRGAIGRNSISDENLIKTFYTGIRDIQKHRLGKLDIPEEIIEELSGVGNSAMMEFLSDIPNDFAGVYKGEGSLAKMGIKTKVGHALSQSSGLHVVDGLMEEMAVIHSLYRIRELADISFDDVIKTPKLHTMLSELDISRDEWGVFNRISDKSQNYLDARSLKDSMLDSDLKEIYPKNTDIELAKEMLIDKFENLQRNMIEEGRALRPNELTKAYNKAETRQGYRALNKVFFFMKNTALNSIPDWYKKFVLDNTYMGSGKQFNWHNKRHLSNSAIAISLIGLGGYTGGNVSQMFNENDWRPKLDEDNNGDISNYEAIRFGMLNIKDGAFINTPFYTPSTVRFVEGLMEGDIKGAMDSYGLTRNGATGLYNNVANTIDDGRKERRAYDKKWDKRISKQKSDERIETIKNLIN